MRLRLAWLGVLALAATGCRHHWAVSMEPEGTSIVRRITVSQDPKGEGRDPVPTLPSEMETGRLRRWYGAPVRSTKRTVTFERRFGSRLPGDLGGGGVYEV